MPSARSVSAVFVTPSAASPVSQPRCPKTARSDAAARAWSSSASRFTWMAASMVGALVASRPLAARRASSSANSGEPPACAAMRSATCSPSALRPVAEHGARDGPDRLLRQRTELDLHVVSPLEPRAPSRGAGRRRAGRKPLAPRARQQVVDPHHALVIRPLRVLDREHERRLLRRRDRDVRQRDPDRVARPLRVVDVGERLVGDEARDQLPPVGREGRRRARRRTRRPRRGRRRAWSPSRRGRDRGRCRRRRRGRGSSRTARSARG